MRTTRPLSLQEHWWRRLRRRILSISAVTVLAAVFWPTAWLTLPAAVIWDLLTRRKGLPTARFALLAMGYPLLQALGLSYLFFTAPLRWSPRWHQWNERFQVFWGHAAHGYLQWIYSLTLKVEGLEALEPGPILLLMRHTSQADTLLIPHLVGTGLHRNLRYVLKRDLRLDPCFDLLGERGHHAFVSRGKDPEGDRQQIRWLLQDLTARDIVVIYPEGTRTSPEKKERLARRLQEQGETRLFAFANSLKHLLPPRLGGCLALLEDNPGCDLVLCGHVGLEGASRFDRFREGALTGKRVHVRFWRVPWSEVPPDANGRTDWLLAQWKALDDWVDQSLPEP